MSEPQLRCLLCDLILADESARDQPTETCKQCGRKVLAGQTQDAPPDLQPLAPPPRPKPLDLDIDLLPEAAVVPPTPAVPPPTDDIPVVGKARRVEPDVPTVQPRGKITTDPTSVPYAAKRGPSPTFPTSDPPRPTAKPTPPPPRKVTLPDPARTASVTPRPQMLKALAVLGCMTLLAVVAIGAIVFTIVYGLKKAAKTEAPRPTHTTFVAPA